MRQFQALAAGTRAVFPGLLVALVIALASGFVSEHYGGPTLLYALLLGMALNHLSGGGGGGPGIAFAARPVLRSGVALLGVRITYEQLLALGPRPVLLVLIGVPLTIGFGLLLARLLKRPKRFGALTAGSVAICGASAAMAIASILPRHGRSDRELVFTVIGVTSLSTIAMILYPILVAALDFDPVTSGIFIGATIHDVAQVVGAGYLLGDQAGDTATFTKLLRVGMLVPTVLIISLVMARHAPKEGKRPPLLPGFLVGFLALVGANSLGWIPAEIQAPLTQLSRWCLVTAIAAIGIKASVAELAELGWTPLLMLVAETLFLAALAAAILFLH